MENDSPKPPFADYQNQYPPLPPYPPYPPYPPKPPKSKGTAIFLSGLIPGSGHFYLGLMKRGLAMMIGFMLNIALIPMIAIQYENNRNWMDESLFVPLITFISLLLPVQYFYAIFDAAHRAGRINNRSLYSELWTEDNLDELPIKTKTLGNVLVFIGVVLLLCQVFPASMATLLTEYGGTVFALLLIGGGGLMLFRMK